MSPRAAGGGAGDNFSDAFDLRIDDTLGSGLSYVPSSATVSVAGNTILSFGATFVLAKPGLAPLSRPFAPADSRVETTLRMDFVRAESGNIPSQILQNDELST